jgi:hypothetical protein
VKKAERLLREAVYRVKSGKQIDSPEIGRKNQFGRKICVQASFLQTQLTTTLRVLLRRELNFIMGSRTRATRLHLLALAGVCLVTLLGGGCSGTAKLIVLETVTAPGGRYDALSVLRASWAGNGGIFIVCVVPHGGQPTEDDDEVVMRGFEFVGKGQKSGPDIKFTSSEALTVGLVEGKITHFTNYIQTKDGPTITVTLKEPE